MRIDELPGIERSHASWWKLVAAMGVIDDLEKRVAELEAALRTCDAQRIYWMKAYTETKLPPSPNVTPKELQSGFRSSWAWRAWCRLTSS